MDHPSYIKNTYDFVEKIKALTLPDNCLLITLDVESFYTNIDHTKGLQAVRDVMGNYPKYDPIIELLEISLKSNDFLFNDEWFIQKVGTSVGRDWAPHYADIYIAKFEKEALIKCPLKPQTYFRCLHDIFIIWSHGKDTFSGFLNMFNIHESPIKFKSFICIYSVIYLAITVFEDPKNNNTFLTNRYSLYVAHTFFSSQTYVCFNDFITTYQYVH